MSTLDGRILVGASLAALLAATAVRGSHGVVRTTNNPRFIRLEPKHSFGATIVVYRNEQHRLPADQIHAKELAHLHAKVLEAFLDTKTERVIFFSDTLNANSATIEVVCPDNSRLVLKPTGTFNRRPFSWSDGLARLATLMDQMDRDEAEARGSHGVVRTGRNQERFVQLEPYSLEVDLKYGSARGKGRVERKLTWNVELPNNAGQVYALNLHARPDVIEAFLDTKTQRVIFFSTQKWDSDAQIEVRGTDGSQLVSWNPSDPKERVPYSQDLGRLVALMDSIDKERKGSQGIVRKSKPAPLPLKAYKITKYDFRPRTRPGFYTRKGGDVIRVDYVTFIRPQLGHHLNPTDWWCGYTGTLTAADPRLGPSISVPATGGEMQTFELGNWRRIAEDKLKPGWKAWFDAHPLQ